MDPDPTIVFSSHFHIIQAKSTLVFVTQNYSVIKLILRVSTTSNFKDPDPTLENYPDPGGQNNRIRVRSPVG